MATTPRPGEEEEHQCAAGAVIAGKGHRGGVALPEADAVVPEEAYVVLPEEEEEEAAAVPPGEELRKADMETPGAGDPVVPRGDGEEEEVARRCEGLVGRRPSPGEQEGAPGSSNHATYPV